MEFSEETKQDHVTPDWAEDMTADDFISYLPSYVGGDYRNLFAECLYPEQPDAVIDVGHITYYLYDPTAHGADPAGSYPLLVFLHGATNALDGKICVSHSGGEMFASPAYQKAMGGAWILVPLANEKQDAQGNLCDSWSDAYLPHLAGLIAAVKQRYEQQISKIVIGGGSSGGWMTWRMLETYPELFAGGYPVSSHYLPEDAALRRIADHSIKLLVACGRHDEFGAFGCITPEKEALLRALPGCICYFPEWVRNGDHGIASLYFGIEMGQHCMITQLQANLMFTDGTPYSPELPAGVTGWVKEI